MDGRATPAERKALAEPLPAGVRLSVQKGAPHRIISRHAARIAADVVILGPRVERTLAAGLLGTTAERVIRNSRVPCLLSNAPLSAAPARILVAMDRSIPAREAFTVCGNLVQTLIRRGTNGIRVHLVTISALAQARSPRCRTGEPGRIRRENAGGRASGDSIA
jgi:hypothetical protein